MRIDVRFRHLEASGALREHVARRVHFHLSRFGHEISSVELRVSDLNGPKGGLDKQCHVLVRGPRLSPVTIEDRGGDVRAVVDLAVERVGRAVGRELERVRAARAPAVPPRKAS